jgi:hypothetical protein
MGVEEVLALDVPRGETHAPREAGTPWAGKPLPLGVPAAPFSLEL